MPFMNVSIVIIVRNRISFIAGLFRDSKPFSYKYFNGGWKIYKNKQWHSIQFGKEHDVFDAINELQIYLRQLSSRSNEVTHLFFRNKVWFDVPSRVLWKG